ncbi:MAG: flagellar hook-length control protein FliK [Burkholderiales bacterium]|nr:flagellar hook-length control protein FliK [Burkholderiales bacterium]
MIDATSLAALLSRIARLAPLAPTAAPDTAPPPSPQPPGRTLPACAPLPEPTRAHAAPQPAPTASRSAPSAPSVLRPAPASAALFRGFAGASTRVASEPDEPGAPRGDAPAQDALAAAARGADARAAAENADARIAAPREIERLVREQTEPLARPIALGTLFPPDPEATLRIEPHAEGRRGEAPAHAVRARLALTLARLGEVVLVVSVHEGRARVNAHVASAEARAELAAGAPALGAAFARNALALERLEVSAHER